MSYTIGDSLRRAWALRVGFGVVGCLAALGFARAARAANECSTVCTAVTNCDAGCCLTGCGTVNETFTTCGDFEGTANCSQCSALCTSASACSTACNDNSGNATTCGGFGVCTSNGGGGVGCFSASLRSSSSSTQCSVCGDGVCDGSENPVNCPSDCQPSGFASLYMDPGTDGAITWAWADARSDYANGSGVKMNTTLTPPSGGPGMVLAAGCGPEAFSYSSGSFSPGQWNFDVHTLACGGGGGGYCDDPFDPECGIEVPISFPPNAPFFNVGYSISCWVWNGLVGTDDQGSTWCLYKDLAQNPCNVSCLPGRGALAPPFKPPSCPPEIGLKLNFVSIFGSVQCATRGPAFADPFCLCTDVTTIQ